jgi:mannose-6-phosphate isomerase-like protein (cupin superfamily)
MTLPAAPAATAVTPSSPDRPAPSRLASAPMIISARSGDDGRSVRGTSLVMQDWPAEGLASEVAPLHVHHADDEAWHVIAGALRFRFADHEVTAAAGSTVLVPAGVPHTFGNAGPERSRFIIILPARLDEMISLLHQGDPAGHPAIYRRYESELLE